MQVSRERSGWRDERLSERHRKYGWDCPAVDIDFLLIEYANGEPKALVEYKHEHAKIVDVKNNKSVQALVRLACNACLPAFLVRYADDFTWFKVLALNMLAAEYLPGTETVMDEVSWVEVLYAVRGLELPAKERFEIENLPHERRS